MATAPRRRWRRRWWLWAIIAAMAVIAVVVVDLAISTESGVTVTEVHWFGSNACGGLSGSTTGGFRGAEGGMEEYTVTGLVNSNSTPSCTIRSIQSMVPGFTVLRGSFPLTILAGATANLTITLSLPGTAYDAGLSLRVG